MRCLLRWGQCLSISQPLRTCRWLFLGGKAFFQHTTCSGWLRLCSRSSSGWPWCEWCRTRSSPPSPSHCGAQENWKTDHSLALNALFLTFARQHVYLRPYKKSPRMGCKCLSVSAPIIVKEGLDPAARCVQGWDPWLLLWSHSHGCLERWIKADRHRYRLTQATPRWMLLEFTRN